MKKNYSFKTRGATFVLSLFVLILWFQPSFAEQGFTPETSLDRGIPIPAGYPTASTTGIVGAGIDPGDLTPYTGTYTLDGLSNTVVELKDISGYMHIKNCANVTIRHCRIISPGNYFCIRIESSNSMITIEECELGTTTEGTTTGITVIGGGIDSLIVRNCDISGGADGMKVTSNNLIEGNYIHHLYRWFNPLDLGGLGDWTHNDCLQTLTAFNVIIRGNTLLGPYHYANSTFQCQTDAGSISDITFEDNYLSGGGNSLNIRESSGKTVTNMTVRNNLWEDGTFLYGPYKRVTVEAPVTYGNRFTSGGECDIITEQCVPNDNQTSYNATVNNFSRDRTMFDSDMARGNNNAEVGISGTSNAPNGYSIEARAVSTDDGGATTTAWRSIATVSNGSWSGVLNTPRSSSWYKAEVRVAGSSSTAITSNRFGVGLIIFHSGQSNYSMVVDLDGSATPLTIGSNGDNFQIYKIENRGSVTGSDANSTIEGPYFITDAAPRTDGLRAIAAMYHKNAPGLKVMALFDVKPGVAQEATLKDSDTRRMWQSIQKLFGKGAWAGTGPMADGQHMGIFIQGHVNDIIDELMADWYAATCLGKRIDGSDISGVSHTSGFPTTDVFANVGGSWQHLYINHLWTEAMPGLRTGRTQVQLKEPGATYKTNEYPEGYDLRRQARENLSQTYFPDHFHWANDYPFLKRYYPDAYHNANHFDINSIYGSPLKGQSLAVSVLRQIGAIPFDIPHFDIITKTSTYIELGSSAGPVTTMARAQGDNTNFTADVDPVGAAGLAEVQGFQYANFKQPTRVEIVDNNGNRASSGKIRVYLDNGYSDLYYAMGASGCTGELFNFNDALFMRHLPIVDVGITGGLMEYGVWVEPYTDREFINHGIPNISVTGVALSADQLEMTVGQTIKLNAIISPANASNKNVDWTSVNASIATVDQFGNVTAVSTGSTTITVTTQDGHYTATCSLTVTSGGAVTTNVALNKPVTVSSEPEPDNAGSNLVNGNETDRWAASGFPQWAVIDLQDTYQLSSIELVTYQSRDYQYIIEASLDGVSYTTVVDRSSNTEGTNLVDAVDIITRYVKIILSGANTYTGTWSTLHELYVYGIQADVPILPESISVNPEILNLDLGETGQIVETVLPENANDKSVTWSSSNASVATVANGIVSAQAVGTATITATTNTGGLTASCVVNVTDPTPSQSAYAVNSLPGRIQIEDYDNGGEGVAFHDAEEKKLDLTIRPEDNVDLEATSDVDGAINMGWSSNGEWLEYTLADVAAGIYSIDVRASSGIASPGDILVKLGDGPDGVNFVTIATVPISGTGGWENWQTFSVNNISIDAGTNKVLRLQFDEAGYDINWIEFIPQIPIDIILTPTTADLHIGETIQISETVLPDGAADKTVTWSSSNVSVATVDANGIVSAQSIGTATITATTNTGGLTASCVVNVSPISVSGVSLDLSSLTLDIGGSADLEETVAPIDATDKSVTWSSSNTAIATVDANGVVSALSDGQTSITATTVDGGYTAQCTVTVNSGGATPINVALNKPVTVSSEPEPANGGSNIVDGDISTRWSASGFPQWAEIDLGDTYQLSSVELVTYQDRNYQYIIEASLDGSSYTTIVDRSSSCQGANLVDAVDIIARYVKISVSGACTYTGTWSSLLELSVYGVPAEVPDPALIDEDFASGASDFTVIAGGTWALSGGRYVLSSPASGATGLLGNISVHNTAVAGDFELSTLINITGTASTWDDAAVVFNYQDINNFYYVSLNESNDQNTKGIFKVENGISTQLADITAGITSDIDYILEIIKTGNDIVVELDDTQIASVTDATFSGGQVGYGSKNDGAQFDDLLVTGGSSAKSLQPKSSISNSLSEMVVYPNPNPGDNVFIELPAKYEFANISVYDISGKKIIYQAVYGEQHINVNLSSKSTLKKGVYILVVSTSLTREISKLIVR